MTNNSQSVVVVLSTFNGEKYLREQLDSLLNQSHKNTRILVRDDGSIDDTRKILDLYSRTNSNFDVFHGDNIGVVASFLQLIKMVPPKTDYVALCDQDDVWNIDKIERAISCLTAIGSGTPVMYCGAVEIVDENLIHLRSGRHPRRQLSLKNALVENVATGCTIVINKAAQGLIAGKSARAHKIAMHDWWLYLVISAFGLVIFDESQKMKYRQHGNNVVGSFVGIKFWANRIWRQFGSNKKEIHNQLKELLHVYGSDMTHENQLLIKSFLHQTSTKNTLSRILYAANSTVYRQRTVDNILLRVLIVLGRI